MSKRNPTPLRTVRLRPRAEGLETRQLLTTLPGSLPVAKVTGHPTAQVSGTDPDGAHWTLKLYGPGTLNVVDANGNAFTKATANTPDSINTITIGGASTTMTRLVGTVTPAPDGNSNVYFQNLVVTPTGQLGRIDSGQVSNFKQQVLGIAAIDMPDFYLAHTDTTKPSTASPLHTTAQLAGYINIPGGVINLRFGGVDATYTPPGGTPLNQTGQSNEFAINLGLPLVAGTSVIVNNVTSTAEANSTSGSPAFQDMVTFLVNGRLNLFQANSINGTTTSGLVPSQFSGTAVSSSNLSPGGTYLISGGGSFGTGQIGDVRVGGNATNFTTLVEEYALTTTPVEGALDAKLSNFFIGGETNNVMMIAPSGARNVQFGLGMDNTTINSLAIKSLKVNRDATNSTVTVSRSIQNLNIGGNVENTNIQAGYQQSLFAASIFPSTSIFTSGSGVFFGSTPPTITNRVVSADTQLDEPLAQNGGSIVGRIAGNIVNSIISASVDPNPSGLSPSVVDNSGQFQSKNATIFPFGAASNLYLPRGVINLKFEGVVDNSASPLLANGEPVTAAFFAKRVRIKKGPVIPPNVPYEPYVAPTVYHRGQDTLKGVFKVDHIPSNLAVLRRAQRAAEAGTRHKTS
jgi:hypothetical protein